MLHQALETSREGGEVRNYRFGFGDLELDSDDAPLNRRFNEIYPEGLQCARASAAIRVRCRVRALRAAGVAAIEFDDPEDLDSVSFCRALFPSRGYVEGPDAAPGWSTLAPSDDPAVPVLAMNGNHMLADLGQTWQPFVANLAVNRVLRLQREVIFLHAGSIAIRGQGLLVVGPKKSGKTTTALTLASRGHGFLGDEIAAVCHRDRRMLPFRRAASIREGVRAERVSQRLGDGDFPVERFPDGAARVLANVETLFPEARAADARLTMAFFLRRFEKRPAVEPFEFAMRHFPLLTPMACSVWGSHAGSAVLRISRMMREVRCFHLDPGTPEATADLIERTAEEEGH